MKTIVCPYEHVTHDLSQVSDHGVHFQIRCGDEVLSTYMRKHPANASHDEVQRWMRETLAQHRVERLEKIIGAMEQVVEAGARILTKGEFYEPSGSAKMFIVHAEVRDELASAIDDAERVVTGRRDE